jgi:hypothetical protein
MSLPQPAQGCNPPQIRNYPQIAALAIKCGYASAYRLYTLVQVRATINQGRCIFTRAEILAFCKNLGVMNEQAVDRALYQGTSLLWTYSPEHRTYKMISRAKVAAALGFTANPGRAVVMPPKAFQGRLADWKAAVYAAYLGQLYQATPSREYLCEVFGVSLPTLLDWEKRAGINVRPRLVTTALPAEIVGPGEDQAVAYATSTELDRSQTARVWLTVVGKRGRLIAGRRLMDNHNQYFDDYWQVQQEPGWEAGSTIRLTWQTTNSYSSPLNVAPTGRGSWLEAEIKRLTSIPDRNAMGRTERRPTDSWYDTRPGWHDNPVTAAKWQKRKWNRSRPVIIAHYHKERVVGEWQPSHAALWGEA